MSRALALEGAKKAKPATNAKAGQLDSDEEETTQMLQSEFQAEKTAAAAKPAAKPKPMDVGVSNESGSGSHNFDLVEISQHHTTTPTQPTNSKHGAHLPHDQA